MRTSNFHTMPLAIIGMACRYPGADNLEEYWRLILERRCAIRELASDRLNRNHCYSSTRGVKGKSYSAIGGVVDQRPLDETLCPIPEEFSANHESTAAIMLEVAATALRDANLDPFAKPKNRTGVYIGHARGSSLAGELVFTTRIEEVLGHLERIEPFDAWTSDVKSAVVRQVIQDVRRTNPCRDLNGGPDITGNVVARIVSLALGLDGPYQAIDAACASSVYALSVAARALHAGEIQTALIGAASYSSWLSTILFSQAQALSANGSFPFDARADGFVSSDGYGALIVTTLDQALKDGDRIYSVISGVGVSSDGRGKSLWAPRLEGQVLAMQRAYRHVSESVVPQYIEAHGTSTQLGDATEIESISSVLRERGATQKVPVASVKANIGHTVEAAGLAGIIKTVLAMHHKVIPAATNFEHPNGNIDFENSPVFIPTESTDWPSLDSGERRAGVNSFAIGGLNGHVALSSVGDGDPKLYAVGLPALKPGNDEESVAIVGQGAVFAGARTAEGLGKLFDHSIRAIAPVPDNRWDSRRFYADAQAVPFRSSTRLGGFVTDFEYDWRRRGIPPKQLQTSDPLRFMIYDAVDQALCDAGLENREFDKKRTAVVVGTILTSDFFSELSLAVRAPEASAAIRTALGDHGISGADADEIVAEFASGFLTSNVALDDETGSFSASTLASGVARTFDFMGGAFVVDAGESSAFAALAAGRDLLLSGDFDVVVCAGAQRHLSLDGYEWYGMRGLLYQDCEPLAGGMIPGEGAGVVILKRLSDAQSAGDPVRAVLRSVSGSMAETAAQESSGSPPRFAGKGQSLVGHTMAASGMVTLLEGMASLERSKADGPLALECDSFGGLQFRAVLEPASNASGTDALRQDDWRTICLSAATLPELALRLGRASGEANSLFESARSYRDFASQSVRYDRHRLAIAFDSPESLAAKLTLAASLVGKPKSRPALEEQGAFLWDATQTPRIAMLFPGQGSQYEGMLRELLEASPAAAEKRRELDALLEADGRPGFAEIALGQGENLIDDVWGTQIAVYLGDLIFHAALLELGVRPEVLVGHSYGEYAALVAAKAWSSEQGLRVTNERCKAILSDERCRGVLIATNAPIDDVVRLQAGIAGIVEIANHNAPDQIVFGGEEPAAMELDRRLAAAGFSNRVLAVPRPFHTSLMASAMTPFRASLAFERIRLLSIPLLSSVTNRYVTDPLEIRENLVNQFVRPVLYADLVRRLVDDGANILIESGPRQILSRLNRRILGPDEQVAVLSADNPKRPGVESLARIAAALQSAGAISGASTTAPVMAAIKTPRAWTGPIDHFDATERRRMALRVSTQHTPETKPVVAKGDEPTNEFEAFLVDFICDNTGYPRDIVSLDADIEADLGIDSLKKAQMLGELKERFNIAMPSSGRFTLDEYPTLRHVLQLLQPSAAYSPAADGAEPESMRRWVLRMRPASLQAASKAQEWHGRAAVFGSNKVADALRSGLSKAGAEVVTVDEAVAELEREFAKQPVLHLFLTQACDQKAREWRGEAEWNLRFDSGLMQPFLVCQRWIQLLSERDLLHRASLVAVTCLGGDFGFESPVEAPEGGAIRGFLKSIKKECESLTVKVIDHAAGEPAQTVADAVFAEVGADLPEVEIGYVRGQRHVVKAIPRDLRLNVVEEPRRGSVWVVTGGGRGVTAIAARELAARYGLRLFLIGSTPLDSVDAAWADLSAQELEAKRVELSGSARESGRRMADIWPPIEKGLELRRTLREFGKAGVDATYLCGDVGDWSALGALLQKVREIGGPIEGVIHGAGIESACRFGNKQIDKVRTTLAVKAGGAAALMALTEDDPIRWFVTFGSVNGRFGGLGQTDYSMASDMLPSLMQALRAKRAGVHAVNFDWPAWDEAGMSVRSESRLALESAGFAFMPSAEGAEFLSRELLAGAPEAEVLILDSARIIDHDHIMPSPAEAEAWAEAVDRISDCPLVSGVNELSEGCLVAEIRFDPGRDPFIAEHLYKANGVLPAVIGIEALAEAASLLAKTRVRVLRDVQISNMFRFSDRPVSARVHAKKSGEEISVRLLSAWHGRNGVLVDPNREFVSGFADPGTQYPPALPSGEVPGGNWEPAVYLTQAEAEESGWVSHGSKFRGLTQMLCEDGQAWGRITAPDASNIGGDREGEWIVPSVVLDSCLVACALHARKVLGKRQLPKSFDRVSVFGVPAAGEACLVHARLKSDSEQFACYDFVLYDAAGQALVSVDGYHSATLLE